MVVYIVLDNFSKFFYPKITIYANSHIDHVAGENSVVTVTLTVPDGTVALYGTCIIDPLLAVCPFTQKTWLLIVLTLTIILVAVTYDESDIDADITKYVLVPS